MRKILAALLLTVPLGMMAQNPYGQYQGGQSPGGYPSGYPGGSTYGNMNQEDMNKMMLQMQEATACMEKVDQAELRALEARAKQFENEMRQLCASGNRSEAQSKAIKFSREVLDNKSVKQLRKCTEGVTGAMKGMMQQMQQNMPGINKDRDYSKTHVCDGFN